VFGIVGAVLALGKGCDFSIRKNEAIGGWVNPFFTSAKLAKRTGNTS